MKKKTIETIYEKNRIIRNIIKAIATREYFLILGHKMPDEDCVASMVSIALILSKFLKEAKIYIDSRIHEHYQYLLNICTFNSIQILDHREDAGLVDAIIICDTPKPSMIDTSPGIHSLLDNEDVLKIEIDHHLGADSEYIGSDGYCLVSEASSTCELIGLIAFKLKRRVDLLELFSIDQLMTRNLVLSILTGIIGDSKMGQFLKSKREQKYYSIFSRLYNSMLVSETTKESNFTDMGQVFTELQRLSTKEEQCFNFIIDKKKKKGDVSYVVMSKDDMKFLYDEFDADTIVSVTRTVADILAEDSEKLGLVAYYDYSGDSNLVQFRLRRSQYYKIFDVRTILDLFKIEDGGGHEGAIGFRVESSTIKDINDYVMFLINGMQEAMSSL
ncbi:MAG: DHH family phosphoesterase [Spirochaetes bacterium]|jgi:nanoRNase/pAp phosphatase (c-di-AMP/oligoRNAs hydrolase)|nr:DHH family phosphoesterase [Spirochaetota bacterium]